MSTAHAIVDLSANLEALYLECDEITGRDARNFLNLPVTQDFVAKRPIESRTERRCG